MEAKQKQEIKKKIEKLTQNKKDPCIVGSYWQYGGECKEGFHQGCFTCPKSQGLIKDQEQIDNFNKVLKEEFKELLKE